VTYAHLRFASWRWMSALCASILVVAAASLPTVQATGPSAPVEVIVQLNAGAATTGEQLVHAFGGEVTRDLPIINGVGARLSADGAERLAEHPAVRAVSPNAEVEERADDLNPHELATSYNQSIRSDRLWSIGATGRGVTVAVIDTGIAGGLPDFRASETDQRSRVVASAVVHPYAETAGDGLGHGTHVAGLIAGSGGNRDDADPLDGKYTGVAPDAKLVSVKVADEDGNSTVVDVIDGLQFVVDKKDELGIRVVNLSLNSTWAESYRTDPLAAAAEQAWNAGLVVVTAAGNRGTDGDAVHYAPANDPFVIVAGAVDDQSTKSVNDDALAPWSSRGVTQDGLKKPDVLAPGARLISTLAPGSRYATMCPDCVVDGEYFRVGGTSMAAAVTSGAAAALIQLHPNWSNNRIKAALVNRLRDIIGVGGEIALDKANVSTDFGLLNPNLGALPSRLIDPATGAIDWTRASWSRASWSDAADPLRASWSRASWSRASWSDATWSSVDECVDAARASWSRASWSAGDDAAAREVCAEWERASWSRASWSRASWSRASWSRASWSTSFAK
jgi:serine protease AprX